MAGREKITYWKAEDEIVELANRIMASYNPMAVHANVCYMFRSKCSKRGGKVVLGRTRKESDKNKLLHGYDYIIEIGADAWQELDGRQREALLMHEILHIDAVEDEEAAGGVAFSTNQHDTEEFRRVIEVYGLWTPDLEELGRTIEARALREGDKVVTEPVREQVDFDDDGEEDIFDKADA